MPTLTEPFEECAWCHDYFHLQSIYITTEGMLCEKCNLTLQKMRSEEARRNNYSQS
jgi:uncharacterized protein with PIN domain